MSFKFHDQDPGHHPVHPDKINLDELYKKKHDIEEHRRTIYGKILNRAHSKIKTTSRLKHREQFCFYVVPEFILGVAKYNLQDCTNYVIEKLMENGFFVKFTKPNLLFISWQHFIPFYEREEIKKTHGVNIDGFGNVIQKKNSDMFGRDSDSSLFNQKTMEKKKEYKNVDTYQPTGTIYDSKLINIMNRKL